ncbi:MAG TPA: hypothetical protein VEU30_07570 [Thermoanaerobaculia bacterium]|nr:hypothetical protein [Thermoanaerobaculia bacterium]
MTTRKLNAEPILRKLAAMRRSIPFLGEAPPRIAIDGRMTALDEFPLETAEDFEYAAVAEGLQSLADDVSALVAQQRARLEEQALEIYDAAEELARDPEHADLIPHVERMRAAYENDRGRPIPPRNKAGS